MTNVIIQLPHPISQEYEDRIQGIICPIGTTTQRLSRYDLAIVQTQNLGSPTMSQVLAIVASYTAEGFEEKLVING